MAGIGASPIPPPVSAADSALLGGGGGAGGDDDKVDEGFGGQLEGELAADAALADQLLTAAADGELEVVKALVAQGVDVDAAPDSEETALMVAAREGHQSVVEFLVSHASASVNLCFDSGWTALHYAVYHAHAALARWLVETGGADPTLTIRDGGVSALTMADTDATKADVAAALKAGVAARKAAAAAKAAATKAPTPKPTTPATPADGKTRPTAAVAPAAALAPGTTTTVGSTASPTAAAAIASSSSAAAAAAATAAAADAHRDAKHGPSQPAVVVGVQPSRVAAPAAAPASASAAAMHAAKTQAGIAIVDEFAAIDQVLAQFRKLYEWTCATYQPRTPITPYGPLLSAIDAMASKRLPLSTLTLNGDSPLWDRSRPRITLPQLVPLFDILGGQFAHAPFTTIDLSHSNLPGAIVPSLNAFLKHTATLTALNLQGNDIDSENGIALSRALWAQDTLLALNLRGNPLGDKANCAFAKMLKHNKTLTDLHMGHTDAATVSLVRYAVALAKFNTTLTAINLDAPLVLSASHGSGSDESTTVHFARMLSSPSSALRSLSLAQHRMRDFGADWMAQFLAKNKRLTSLDLSKNQITFSGVAALVKALAARPVSATIALHANTLTDGAGATLRLRPLDEVDELLLAAANKQPSLAASASAAAAAAKGAPAAAASSSAMKVTVTGADGEAADSAAAAGGDAAVASEEWWRANAQGFGLALAPSDSKSGLKEPQSGCWVTFESKLDRHRLVAAARNPALDSASAMLPSASAVFGTVAPARSSEV